MGLGDCVRCIKYLLFVFNLIFCLIGLVILGFGVWIYVGGDTHFIPSEVNEGISSVKHAGLFLMIIGGIITVLGFLGCCGAVFENRVLLVLFFIVMLLVFIILVAMGIAIVFLRHAVTYTVGEGVNRLVHKRNESDEWKNKTDALQTKLHCCGGTKGFRDYTDNGRPIPASCNTTSGTGTGPYEENCADKINKEINKYSVIIIAVIFVTAFITLLGVIFSMVLCCAIGDMA